MELTKDENVYKITKELEIINGLKYLTVEVEDQNGKKIYGKRSPPEVEFSWEYDEKQNMICYKNSLGLRIVREYDEKGNVIHYKDTNGSEWRYEYDQNGNEIHRVSSTGSQIWQDYDVDGKLIHYRNSSGYEYHQEYDNNGKVSHFKDSTGEDYWYEYNEKGQKIGAKDSDGKVLWKSEYNEQNQEVHTKFSTGLEYWEKYDENGNLVSFKSSNGHEKTSEYSTLIIPQGVDLLETIKNRVEQELTNHQENKVQQSEQSYNLIEDFVLKVKQKMTVNTKNSNLLKTIAQIIDGYPDDDKNKLGSYLKKLGATDEKSMAKVVKDLAKMERTVGNQRKLKADENTRER